MASPQQPATPTPAQPPPPPQEPQSHFPQDLPPRKFTQTWLQRNKFSAKTFFTAHYASFSPFRRRNARDTWRRVSMLLTLLARLGLLILVGILLLYNLPDGAAGIVLVLLFALVAWGLLLVDCWSLALIGDATGTRRSCGITVRRTGLDIFLHVQTVLHIVVCATFIFWVIWFLLAGVWLFLGLLFLIVGLLASTEPIDEYGSGVNV